jgi:hypothetical protein
MAYGHTIFMASPPLPSLGMRTEADRFGLQLGYVDGRVASRNPDPVTFQSSQLNGHMFGGGGAVSFGRAFSESYGVYLMGVGDNLAGEFNYANTTSTTYMRDVKSTSGTLAAGVAWTILGIQESPVALGIFGGPSVTFSSMSQKVSVYDGTGALSEEFDMKMTPMIFSALVGVQLGFFVTQSFYINPFATVSLPFTSQCQSYEVTSTSRAGTLSGQSTSACGGQTNGVASTTDHKIDLKTGFQSIGVNLVFPGAGLVVGLYSLPDRPSDANLKEMDLRAYMLGLTFMR